MNDLLKRLYDRLLLKLPERAAFRMLTVLCGRYGIRSVVADISDGAAIEGSLYDLGMFSLLLRFGAYSDTSPDTSLHSILSKRNCGTYIDIGANIGTTTIPLALKYDWHFYAFEPDPVNFRRLNCNLIRNNVAEKVRAFDVALSAQRTTISLRQSPYNFGDHRLAVGIPSTDTTGWPSVDVQTDTLDSVLSTVELRSPIVIKMDTQGAEPMVFRGGQNVFSRADIVLTEIWPRGIIDMGGEPIAFFDNLCSGFSRIQCGAMTSTAAVRARIQKIISDNSDDQIDVILRR